MAPDAFKALAKGLKDGDFRFVKLFMEYYAGKPTEKKEITVGEGLKDIIINYVKPSDK
jgi:hypothetical protein